MRGAGSSGWMLRGSSIAALTRTNKGTCNLLTMSFIHSGLCEADCAKSTILLLLVAENECRSDNYLSSGMLKHDTYNEHLQLNHVLWHALSESHNHCMLYVVSADEKKKNKAV